MDVDLKNTTHAELKQIALDSGLCPPHELGRVFISTAKLVEEGTLKTYGVKRGDTIFVDVRRRGLSWTKRAAGVLARTTRMKMTARASARLSPRNLCHSLFHTGPTSVN